MATLSCLFRRTAQLACAWLIFVLGAGATYIGPPLLYASIANDLQLSTWQLSCLPSVFLISKGLLALPAGVLVRFHGVRRTLLCGSIALACTGVLYVKAKHFATLLLCHTLFGACYSLCGMVPLVLLCSTWFERERARAIGVLLTGFSFAGILWPLCITAVAERSGWRAAYGVLCVAQWALSVPLIATVVREGPFVPHRRSSEDPVCQHASRTCSSDHCDTRDDVLLVNGSAGESSITWSRGKWLPWWARKSDVWHMAAMNFYALYVISPLLHLLNVFLEREVGLPLRESGAYTSVIFTGSVVGKLLFGVAFDTQRRSLWGLIACALLGLGAALVLTPHLDAHSRLSLRPTTSRLQLGAFAVVYGVGYGACYCLIQVIAPWRYGGADGFVLLQSFLAVWQYVGSFAGILVSAVLRERTTSYTLPFALLPLGALMLSFHFWRVMHNPILRPSTLEKADKVRSSPKCDTSTLYRTCGVV
uniref:Major facilitator superfamily (MFS) profile domain-containing protein n=2 Tax=Calcidiscus leptoporus TaxID=127549 RepID=A0A7S0IIC3_9EUKA|mmetsp:Transcript_10633/g.24663  ORF Transcript_10633/g.24663 Transcript_10633/m.24663 type:complete len:477 (+) Transcript_10633:85-1515(+)